MKLSKRGEYGLRAMIALAGWPAGSGVAQIKDIADKENIPIKFLEQILITLKNAGLLLSNLGPKGGYYLARPPDQITLGQIVRILDGTIAPIRCVSQTSYESCGCPDEQTCGLRMAMLDVRNAISDVLDKTTLADVAERVRQARKNKPNVQ